MPDLLNLRAVSGGYHGQTVVREVSLCIHENEAVAVVGANGAGKTTLLRIIMGQLPATAGQILFRDSDLTALPMHKRARLGIGYAPEGRALFSEMSVEENLEVGAYLVKRDERRARLRHIFSVFPKLERLRHTRCRLLSGGEQQMVTIGRALMSAPRLLLLDEPSTGLAPKVVGELYAALKQLHVEGLSVFVVEQNAYAALRFAERGYVFEDGRVTREEAAQNLLQDPHLVEAYVGQREKTTNS
ncbi:MAG TPA: ABC transporter ATP-binding protein [Ktedonosporobacter sp.]|nr:ABC transporter ATP-binding protein [Ktedonosporobacter sp.]